MKILAAAICLLPVFAASGDVWQDCRAWYSGAVGKCEAGRRTDVAMLDIRHAADLDSSTHGGALWNGNPISNLIQNVSSPTSDAVFRDQCVTYFPQSEKIDDKGAYRILENGVTIPFPVETNQYTVLLRIRFDAAQPTNVKEHCFLDMGYYSSGNQSFNVRLTDDEEVQVCYKNADNKKSFSPTNEITKSLLGQWMELAVQMSNGTIRVGARLPGGETMEWLSINGKFKSAANQLPADGLFHLGGSTRNKEWSKTANAARASYHLIAYWDRVLGQQEIDEAFSWPKLSAVLRLGADGYGSDMFRGATTGLVTDVSRCLESAEDIAAFPSAIENSRSLRFDFKLQGAAADSAQILQVVAADESDAGAFDCRLDGASLGISAIAPGQPIRSFVPAKMMSAGIHTLELVRTDSHVGFIRLDKVEISDSLLPVYSVTDGSLLLFK